MTNHTHPKDCPDQKAAATDRKQHEAAFRDLCRSPASGSGMPVRAVHSRIRTRTRGINSMISAAYNMIRMFKRNCFADSSASRILLEDWL